MNSNLKEIEELTDGWVLCRSKSSPGRQYYFNRKTGKSSWTQPQPSDKFVKKPIVKEKFNHIEKRKKEEPRSKSAKRKSDGSEAGSSKKKVKNETVEKSSPKKPQQKVSPKLRVTNASPQLNSKKNDSPTKSMLSPESQRNRGSPSKVTPTKNLANKRLSQLREQLTADVSDEHDREPSPRKNKRSLTPAPSETPARQRTEVSSPNVTEAIASTATKSPSSDSLHSTPSPSQFLAANKIIHSMRAQLSEEYCNIQKPKDTFSDIEQGICNQINDYPVIKHPSTPPQFSEANKLVSAIKSKLSYKRQDIKFYSSAKERMEAMRASISGEIDESDLPDESKSSPSKCEAMETGDIYDPNEVPNSSVPQPTVKDIDGEHVVLVVDSNIFIHELDFIKNVLNSHIKGYREQPTLLVPWRVINELDRLKDNNNGKGAVCKRARAAMDYLYKSLPENSRIKGQSLRDANSHIYPCELPDDEILNCALQQAERGRNVLLLSNDRNLCNKASVNNIKRCSIAELKELVEHKPQPATDPHLLTQLKHCEHAIYQLLSNILENEMRAKYNNLWQHILFKPPPWQLCDVLQCLLKHWIAVFNEVFPRIEHLITDLKNTHARIVTKDPKTLTHSELENFKELCVDVASKCQIIPEYMALAKLTVERLARRASETDDAGARETVVGAFEELWTHMSSYCAKLATALGVPHAVEDPLPGAEPLPTLATKFTDYNTSVEGLIGALRGVLNTEQSSLEEVSYRLHAALAAALRPAPRAPVPRGEALRDFCLTNRNMLEEALNKFTQLAQLLTACGASVGQCRPG